MSNGRPLDGPWTAEEKMKRIEENRMECNRDEDEEEHNQSSSSSKFLVSECLKKENPRAVHKFGDLEHVS